MRRILVVGDARMRDMKRVSSLVAALICIASSARSAPGLKLAWSSCQGEQTGSSNRTFACDTNSGSELLVLSFESSGDLEHVVANVIVMDVLSQAPAMPAWWDFRNLGSCRTNSLQFNTTFDANNVVCRDWALGASTGGISAYIQGGSGSIDPALDAQHCRIKISLTRPGTDFQDVVSGF